MGRCSNNALIKKVSAKPVTAETEISFAILKDIENCKKVNTSHYMEKVGTATYNSYKMPPDMFNCLASGCRNSGTLMLRGAVTTAVGAKYAVGYDATEFFSGISTFYIDVPTAGDYEVIVTMSDASNPGQTNADVYVLTVTANSEGFQPVIVDFSKMPQSEVGTGWIASGRGAIINISVEADDELVIPNIGLSSIYFYDSFEDFEVNDVVIVSCIDEITGDITVGAVESTCFGGGYDSSTVALEKTITVRAVTPNFHKLNPLIRKGNKTSGWVIRSDEREILETTINDTVYGYVHFPDMQIDECAFTTAALSASCNVTDATLNRVNTPIPVSINERQIIVLDGKTTEISDAGKILFHASRIGHKAIVSYPKKAIVEQFVANTDSLGETKVRMSYPKINSDETEWAYLYNNVLVTSFSESLNKGETIFTITLAVQKAQDGHHYELLRVKE